MCKIGDIILIKSYLHNAVEIGKHSFIVVDDQNGKICGLEYDFVANALSSYSTQEKKERKLKYDGNFPIVPDDLMVRNGNNKKGYLKTDQLYFFNKDYIEYQTIGNVKPDIMDLIIEFINESDFKMEFIIENLHK